MFIYEYFKDDYIKIDNDPSMIIEEFLNTPEEGINSKYAAPLIHIFLHNTHKEMFLILDCINYSSDKIKEFCNEWETRVLCFVNFGDILREQIGYLKYNINLLVLYKDFLLESKNLDIKYEAEKSLNICKKIFILCNDNGEVEDKDVIIPFYFDPIYKISNFNTYDLENDLENLLPKDADLLETCDKEILDKQDIERISGWLNNDKNN